MDWMNLKQKMPVFLQKYKYVILVTVIGLVFMLVPFHDATPESSHDHDLPKEQVYLQDELSEILSMVKGAGKVRVILTCSDGEETVFQTNDDTSLSSDSQTNRTDTVTVTDAQRNETGLIKQVNPPKYLGAVVVAEGADDPSVRLSIAEAVAKATGLGMDRISILKMK